MPKQNEMDAVVMPYSIGLQREQLADLQSRAKKARCSAASFINYAVRRYRRGDFQIPEQDPKEKDIVPFTVWKKLDIEDWKIRCILRCHFSIPDEKLHKKLEEEMKSLDLLISGLMAVYSGKDAFFLDKDDKEKYERTKKSNS